MRYFVKHADSFDDTGDQIALAAELLRKSVYMDQKELIRVAAVKSLSTLIPMMSTRPLADSIFFQSALNYESYLQLMSCLVFALTDEHPEVRAFITNQRLNLLFGKLLTLESPALTGIVIRDSNECLAMESLFESLTTQAIQFEELTQDPNAIQTERFAQMDAV